MAANPWQVGTDSGAKVRDELRKFLRTWLANEKYKSRLPSRHRLSILEDGARERGTIAIRVVSESDAKPPWPYNAGGGKRAVTDTHRIALIVKADQRSGGAESVSAVHGALRALFASRYDTPERTALETAGVEDCMETPEGLEVDPGDSSDEGSFFKQQINLRCETDTFLD